MTALIVGDKPFYKSVTAVLFGLAIGLLASAFFGVRLVTRRSRD